MRSNNGINSYEKLTAREEKHNLAMEKFNSGNSTFEVVDHCSVFADFVDWADISIRLGGYCERFQILQEKPGVIEDEDDWIERAYTQGGSD